MQHGFGDEDYSALARKYFAVLSPIETEKAASGLPEQPAAPPLNLQPLIELLQSAQAHGPAPAVPEIAQEPESTGPPIAPIAEFTPIAPPPSEDRQHKSEKTNAAVERGTPAQSSRESTAEETEARRSFLGRLLRKAGGFLDY